MLAGDRFVVRSLAPQVTIGAATPLDPAPAGRRASRAWRGDLAGGATADTIPLLLARRPD